MEYQSNEAWIIMYKWESTDDWIGQFPENLYDWFVCEFTNSKIPRIFGSEKEASDYAVENALVNCDVIRAAGDGSTSD